MPRGISNAVTQLLKRRGGAAMVLLLDLSLYDGSNFYWSNYAGSYPARITAGNQNYSPWIKSAGPFRITRTLTTDAGDIVCQNLSGNTVERDVSKLLRDHEFEGALAILRFYYSEAEASLFELHGKLSEPNPKETEFKFRILDLFDTSGIACPQYYYQSSCLWRYKSAQCASAGSATSCPKDYASCIHATRNAGERFSGIVTPPPQNMTNFTGLPGLGGGGLDGLCFTPDTMVKVKRVDGRFGCAMRVRFDEVLDTDLVLTLQGWLPIALLRKHWYSGPLHIMPAGWGVTAKHEILHDAKWPRAAELWKDTRHYEGFLFTLEVKTREPHADKYSPTTSHSFTLGDGTVAHNNLPSEK